MLEDCKGAITEVQKLIQTLESDLAKELSLGPGSLKGAAWGEKKSIDELWGDLYSEVSSAALLIVIYNIDGLLTSVAAGIDIIS